MRPRIRRIHGVWHCIALGAEGLGYCPRAAFDDWLVALLDRADRRCVAGTAGVPEVPRD